MRTPTSKTSIELNALYESYLQCPETGLEPLMAKVRAVAKRKFRDDDQAQLFSIWVWQQLPIENIPCTFGAWIFRQTIWRGVDYYHADQSLEGQVPATVDDDGNVRSDEETLDVLTFQAMQAAGQKPDNRLDTIDDPFVQQVARLLTAGHTQDEAAEILGVNPNTLRTRVRRYRAAQEPVQEAIAA